MNARRRARIESHRPTLDQLFAQYHRPELIEPDPLQFVRRFSSVADREIVGLLASGFAYGRVAQILNSLERIITPMGRSPADWVDHATENDIARIARTVRHRWTTPDEFADLAHAMRRVRAEHGSIGGCFRALDRGEPDVGPALVRFVKALGGVGDNSLLTRPEKGSASKRLHLFLRWMVRSDVIDPGGWNFVTPARLIIPLDTHMHRVARVLGLTKRKAANLLTAREITDAFRCIVPEDPVRYDFALTRLGIREGFGWSELKRLVG